MAEILNNWADRSKIRPRGYKTFFMLNSAEHEIFPAHTTVGISTFMSRKNSILALSELEKMLNFLIFLYL